MAVALDCPTNVLRLRRARHPGALEQSIDQSAQSHRAQWLVQQMVATLTRFAQALGCGIAAHQKRRDRRSVRFAKISNRRDTGLPVRQTIVAYDEVGPFAGTEVG